MMPTYIGALYVCIPALLLLFCACVPQCRIVEPAPYVNELWLALRNVHVEHALHDLDVSWSHLAYGERHAAAAAQRSASRNFERARQYNALAYMKPPHLDARSDTQQRHYAPH